jgi:hypothetical protein
LAFNQARRLTVRATLRLNSFVSLSIAAKLTLLALASEKSLRLSISGQEIKASDKNRSYNHRGGGSGFGHRQLY